MPICRYNSCIERSDSMFCPNHRMAKHPVVATPVEAKHEPVEAKAKHSHASAGSKGGKLRAKKLSPERRSEIAKKAAASRWNKP